MGVCGEHFQESCKKSEFYTITGTGWLGLPGVLRDCASTGASSYGVVHLYDRAYYRICNCWPLFLGQRAPAVVVYEYAIQCSERLVSLDRQTTRDGTAVQRDCLVGTNESWPGAALPYH